MTKNVRQTLLDYFNEHKEVESIKQLFRDLEKQGKRLGYTTLIFETRKMVEEGILKKEQRIVQNRLQTHLGLVTERNVT